ncbi:MAG: hypothetical protein ACXVB9_08015 [Bdellovibrionota bacterium]
MELKIIAGIIAAFLSPMLGYCEDKFPATDPCSPQIKLLDSGNIDPADEVCTKTFQDTNSALKAVSSHYLSLNACK